MSAVDVTAAIEIAAEPSAVAAVMFDAHRGPEWMAAIKSVEVLTPALEPGAQARVQGEFLGRAISWTSTVDAVQVPHRLSLRVEGGPFVGAVEYGIDRAGAGSRVTMRNHGETRIMSFLPSSLVEGAMRSAMDADLVRLKELVERAEAAASR